jgi:hypothetical protein
MSPTEIEKYLERIPKLPDSAAVPIAVAAVHDNVSARTVRRCYPLVTLSPQRKGVPLGFLRHRQPPAA